MKIKIFTSVLFALCTTPIFAQQIQVLDGKTYKIVLTSNGQDSSKETFEFDNGMFDPLDCHKWGFNAADYVATTSGATISWKAICKSEKEGTMVWEGKVTGHRIEGKTVWSKEGQAPITYTFTGREIENGEE